MRTRFAIGALAALSSCTAPTLDQLAPFACAQNGLCPSEFSCVAGQCVKGADDASAGDGSTDGPVTESGVPDASDGSTLDVIDAGTPIAILRASVSALGDEGKGHSGGAGSSAEGILGRPQISTDGKVIAFASEAFTLAGNATDNNSQADVLIYAKASIGWTDSIQSHKYSGPGFSLRPVLSGDGKYVAYKTAATLTNGGGPDLKPGCVWQDVVVSTTPVRLQVSDDGTCIPYGISGTGRFVVYTDGEKTADGTTLSVFDTSTKTKVKITNQGAPSNASISADGKWVSFITTASLEAGETNGLADMYIADASAATIKPALVSRKPSGLMLTTGAADGAMAADGEHGFFATKDALDPTTDTDTDTDLYLVDKSGGVTSATRASNTGIAGTAGMGAISADGRYSVFEFTPNAGVSQAWMYDATTNTTTSLHKTSTNGVPNAGTAYPGISGDGLWVTFQSDATNIVPSDTNAKSDVFFFPRP